MKGPVSNVVTGIALRTRRVFAASVISVAVSTPAFALSADEFQEKLRQLIPPTSTIDTINESSMPGVFEVVINGQTTYAYATEKHILLGDAYDLSKRVSLADEKRNEKMSSLLKSANPDEMIVMKPAETKRVITIFTDIDCGYCRKLHREVPALTEAGIEIRYMMFPRAGIDSGSYKKAVSVWCADDNAAAMTLAKAGGEPEPKTCENPVAAQYKTGLDAGVRGTPTMILDDGTVIPGYVPKDRLIQQLGLR